MIKLYGFDIFNKTKKEFIEILERKISNYEKVAVISGNPEILYFLSNNDGYNNIKNNYLIIPDGIGVVLTSKLLKKSIKEKIAGIEVVEELMKLSSEKKYKIYLLGAEKWVVEKAVENCRNKYNANIIGFRDGYFDLNNCEDIIQEINSNNTDILFVAMGCPRQEKFIDMYWDKLSAKILMGVGGSFDVFAGKVNRAPKWMIKLGLEWLYRVYKEPFRIKRLGVIPKFIISALIYELKKR